VSDAPKFAPKTVTNAPPVAGPLGEEAVTTGASNEKTFSTVPTTFWTASAKLAPKPTPAGAVHSTEESDFHDVVEQGSPSSMTAPVAPGCVPKLVPASVTMAPPLAALFTAETPVIFGESYEKTPVPEPTTRSTVTVTVLLAPTPALLWQMTKEPVIQTVVEQLVSPI
jgi:hypothetical protein